jgi:multiple sugar transport system substrate-binding protein
MRSRSPRFMPKVLVTVSIVAALALTAACGGGKVRNGDTNGTAKQITIALSDSPSATALKAIAPEFKKSTGVEVKFVDLPYNQLATKVLLASKKSSNAFDVIQFDSPMLASLAAGGALADIGEKVTSSIAYGYSDFPAPVQDYAKYRGTTYAIPLSTEPYVLWYRTDLFTSSG